MKNLYLRFLSLSQAIKRPADCDNAIDETAVWLLEVIALRASQDKPLTVTDAMGMSKIASPATIHRKLDTLRNAGLIVQIFGSKNRRTKYLHPTKRADKYFSELGAVMQSVSKDNRQKVLT
jgi:DNA-binding MarR family transcriptional regulator